MRARILGWLMIPVLIGSLAGCSKSYQDSTRSAVSDMRKIIETYNAAAPHDLGAAASVCETAYKDLTGKSSQLDDAKPPAKYAREAAKLRDAYRAAKDGFAKCARASRSLDTVQAATAQEEIWRANTAITAARSLDH